LAPAGSAQVDMDDPVQRYAFEREAEHLWLMDDTDKALESLSVRTSVIPRDNLRRWLPWVSRVEIRLGADHSATLLARSNIAFWTGECGDPQEALRLFQALLPDQQRVLGGDHPATLTPHSNIAVWTGRCGDSLEALHNFQALLPDHQRVLGADHPATLATRNSIAFW